MIPEIVHALVSRARAGVRIDGLGVHAGHGVADPGYRPPRLPYAAVIGPINLEDEPERDPARSLFLWVRSPGHMLGAERTAGDLVPNPGTVDLLLDGDVNGSIDLDLGALAGQSLTAPGVGVQVAALAEQAVRVAVDADAFAADGAPVTDTTRLAELRATTVRWHRQRSRLVISSGRRGLVADPELTAEGSSQVAVSGGDGGLIDALGLGQGSIAVGGRIYRHRVANPTAMAVDVRLDLWAGSQSELARVSEAWTRITPTRGQLLTQPALLAADLPDGSTGLRLLDRGEGRSRWSLALLEARSGFVDRFSGTAPTLSGAAVIQPDGLRIDGPGEAQLSVYEAPPIPFPWRPDHPAPLGYALSIGLTVDAGAQDGDGFTLLRLLHGNRSALRLDLSYSLSGGVLQTDLSAGAEQADGTQFPSASGRVAASVLEQGATVHVTVDARLGLLDLFVDGIPAAPVPGVGAAAAAPGTPAGGSDMGLVLGDAAAPGNLLPYRIDHLHLHARPLGPPDPRARTALAPASAWGVGDPIALVHTEDGFSASGEAFRAVVTGIAGDLLILDRPVRGTWPQGATIVYRDSLFFAQRQIKRRDDFTNRLYRLTAEYRVSAFLDERFPGLSAPVVETTDVQTRGLAFLLAEENDPAAPAYPLRPVSGRPGVATAISPSPDTPQR